MFVAGGFKRLGILLAALVAAGVAALVAISLVIPAEDVRNAIKAEIRAVTGFEPMIRGDASVSLFPWGTVSFADVSLGDDGSGGRALAAERVTARLRLLPLLFGRIEAADLWLLRPKISLRFAPEAGSNWSGVAEALTRALKPTASPADALMSLIDTRQPSVIRQNLAINQSDRIIDKDDSVIVVRKGKDDGQFDRRGTRVAPGRVPVGTQPGGRRRAMYGAGPIR